MEKEATYPLYEGFEIKENICPNCHCEVHKPSNKLSEFQNSVRVNFNGMVRQSSTNGIARRKYYCPSCGIEF